LEDWRYQAGRKERGEAREEGKYYPAGSTG
jgi:hypothetical protein